LIGASAGGSTRETGPTEVGTSALTIRSRNAKGWFMVMKLKKSFLLIAFLF